MCSIQEKAGFLSVSLRKRTPAFKNSIQFGKKAGFFFNLIWGKKPGF